MGWRSSNPNHNWVQLTTTDRCEMIWVNMAQVKYVGVSDNQTTLHFDQSYRITVCEPANEIILARLGANN
jgi:hypothetical protein